VKNRARTSADFGYLPTDDHLQTSQGGQGWRSDLAMTG
jgi:hypothetical protein